MPPLPTPDWGDDAAYRAALGVPERDHGRFLPVAEAAQCMGLTEAQCSRLAYAGTLHWQWTRDGLLVEPAVLTGDVPDVA
jgi:hypothetical protein